MSVPAPNHASESVLSATAAPRTARRRTDIEGLRAVAALLIAVFHIWFGTVSGGVDVFLVLTGFLITGSLVRAMERDGRLAFGSFWSKLARRLFPAGAVVLGAVLLGAYLLLPRSRWTGVIADVQAAALYYGNWHLSLGSVDYMAGSSAAGPVQHFWSLGVQGQFYLLWPLLIAVAGLVAAGCGLRVRTAALAAVGTVLAVSFGYSLWITAADPVWAYFDTGARLWELALGGVLALVIARVRPPRPLRLVLGWAGLAALVLCGLVIGDALPYPGVASVWPTLAAVAVLLAGAGDEEPGRLSATRLLGTRPLVWLGGRAYTLFLWHWPILVFYLEVTGLESPTLAGGLFVLGSAFAAAVLTTWLVDGSLTRLTSTLRAPAWSLAAGVLCVVPVLLAGLVWGQAIDHDRRLRMELSSDPMSYPGAAVTLNPALAENLPALPVYPDTATVASDTVDQTRECNALTDATEVVSCEFGDPESAFTLVLAGSSHARHWFQALHPITEQHGWRLVMMTKNACQFSADEQVYQGDPYTECTSWNAEVMARIAEIGPDAVFTTATRTTPGGEAGAPAGSPPESTPDGYVERWRELEELGVPVVAVRDTPRFGFNVAECVDREGALGCVEERSFSMADRAPYEDLAEIPGATRFLDLTGHLCGDGVCRGVIGNQLAYYDSNHFSHAFSRSLAVVLEPYLMDALPGAPVAETSLAEAAGPLLGAAESAEAEAS